MKIDKLNCFTDNFLYLCSVKISVKMDFDCRFCMFTSKKKNTTLQHMLRKHPIQTQNGISNQKKPIIISSDKSSQKFDIRLTENFKMFISGHR
mgnify:CR=1 FL=1